MTGKTSVARTLAALAGRKLVEVVMTAGSDTSDLLGGFEQMDVGRHIQVKPVV
jgi:midasin